MAPILRVLALLGLFTVGPLAAAPLTLAVNGSDGKPLAGAVVAVVVKGESAIAPPGTRVQVAQRDRRFEPPLTVIQTGTAVNFPNFDTVRHHVYSFSPIQKFEIKLYAGVPNAPLVFDQPGVATLGCNIHDRMTAWIVVVDTPHFARTDVDGTATLDVPPGSHRLRAWHPALGETGTWAEQALVIGGAATARASVSVPVP